MEEEQQELRYVCKLCNKKYPCGKSLGGHMRSHVVANSAESDDKFDISTQRVPPPPFLGAMNDHQIHHQSFGVGPQSSYGLRENPRKTWRAVDSTSPVPQERVCKQCGKGFQSLKALCGHMACHSDRDKGSLKDDHSWTSENHKLVLDSHSDTEAEDRILRTRSSSKGGKRCSKKAATNNANGSSSVSEVDGEEQQEEVAMCLMLLSRDSGNKGGVNSVVESSDNNSVILEGKSSSIGRVEAVKKIHGLQGDVGKKVGDGKLSIGAMEAENSDSGYFLDECGKAESDMSVDGFRRYGCFGDYSKPLMNEKGEDCSGGGYRQGLINSRTRSYASSELYNEYGKVTRDDLAAFGVPHKRGKYECFNCKKTFKSYQALGGHRPCHKRSNVYYESSRYDSGENSLDDSTEFVAATGKAVESTTRKSSAKNSSSHYTEKKNKASKKSKGHVCPFCDRVFKNGQALGGHKRSHFIGGHADANNRTPATKPDLLDLNLPAPEEDENNEHDQWYQ